MTVVICESNIQGGHELLHLAMDRVISRRKITIILMTETVFQTIKELAKCQGMKGLKLCIKSGHILFDSAWIAGVDYHNSDDYSDKNNKRKDHL